MKRIERAMEMLENSESSLDEIAYTLNYSSILHFSYQFRKITGYFPDYYRQIRQNKSEKL